MTDQDSFAASDPQTKAKPTYRRPLELTLLGLGLGVAFEALFHQQPLGASFPVWAGLSAAALIGASYLERIRPHRSSLWLAPAILALAGLVVFRAEPLTVFLNIVLTLMLFSLWVRTYRGGRLFEFGWLDHLVAQIRVPLEAWIRPWAILSPSQAILLQGRRRRTQIVAATRGGVLALPVIIVFLALLSSADLVFGDFVESALEWLDLERLFELMESGLIVGLSGLFLLGAIAVALRDPAGRRLIGQDKPILSPFLGFTETAIILGAVDLLFAAFVAVQFRYLFGGEANITAAGYTYSEYARRGFGELVAIAFLTLGLILALANWGRRESRESRNGFNALSGVLVGLISVMLVSAFMRLLLYENAFGFTRLRTYTHVAIIWMGVLFAAFLALLLLNRLRRYTLVVALGALGFTFSLSLLNVDDFIVRQNLARWAESGKLDAYYLTTLSEDSVPVIANFVSILPAEEKEILLVDLACTRARLQDRAETTDWRSFRFSNTRALTSLARIEPLLDIYPVTSQSGQVFEVDVEGETRYCSSYGW